MTVHSLDRLLAQIELRKGADPKTSYTAKLLQDGVQKCAKKLGEEGVELALAAVSGSRREIVSESADLLYHLAVLWATTGTNPADVYAELEAREGRSGLDDKAARKNG